MPRIDWMRLLRSFLWSKQVAREALGWLILLLLLSLLLLGMHLASSWLAGESTGNFWSFVWQILVNFGVFVLGLSGGLLATTVGLFVLSSHGTIRVFVSHHHRDEPLAAGISEALKTIGFYPVMLPVRERDRDEVNEWVRKELGRCDVVIAIPPHNPDAYAKAEMLTASTLGKSIIFLTDGSERPGLDTALQGYPVFDIVRLDARQWHPLQHFVQYLLNHHRETGRNLERALETFGCLGILIVLILSVFMREFVPLIMLVAGTSDPGAMMSAERWRIIWTLMGWAIVVMIGLGIISFRRWQTSRVVRQLSSTGKFTPQYLKRSLSTLEVDQAILACLVGLPEEAHKVGKASIDES